MKVERKRSVFLANLGAIPEGEVFSLVHDDTRLYIKLKAVGSTSGVALRDGAVVMFGAGDRCFWVQGAFVEA